MESADVLHDVPVLASRFSSWKHPQTAQLYQYSKDSCDYSLKAVSQHEVVSHNGEFPACGGLYSSWVYPGGDLEKLKVVADFYSAWVFIDDLIDNSTDMSQVSDLIDSVRVRVIGSRQGNQGLDFMHRLFTHDGWHPEMLRLVRDEMDLWFKCTLALREIEAEQRTVSIEEYMTYRQTNAAMGVMYLVMTFAMPEVTEDFLRLNESSPSVIRSIFSYCGRSMGVVLDLYKLNADHAQICEYSHIAKIVQRNSSTPLSLEQAVDRSVELFHEYEDSLRAELDKVASFSPKLAHAMESVHAGSITWLEVMRGGRYVKKLKSQG